MVAQTRQHFEIYLKILKKFKINLYFKIAFELKTLAIGGFEPWLKPACDVLNFNIELEQNRCQIGISWPKPASILKLILEQNQCRINFNFLNCMELKTLAGLSHGSNPPKYLILILNWNFVAQSCDRFKINFETKPMSNQFQI